MIGVRIRPKRDKEVEQVPFAEFLECVVKDRWGISE